MNAHHRLKTYLQHHSEAIGKVVDYNPLADKLLPLDFTAANQELDMNIIGDVEKFHNWIADKLKAGDYRYGIGGYLEHRTIYAVSTHFDTEDEPRRLHLGVDIWGNAGTTVFSPMDGIVHSFQDNNNLGDYGPTIILQHNLNGLTLYSLYGHLSRISLDGLYEGLPILKTQQIATLGHHNENGHWPPHLHFQLMFDMEGKKGDYPGVCKFSEREKYQSNVPDPALILGF